VSLTACLNAFMSQTARMSEGRAFYAEGPAREKGRSPNLGRSWGRAKLEEDVDLSSEREQAALTVCTMLLKSVSTLKYTYSILLHLFHSITVWHH